MNDPSTPSAENPAEQFCRLGQGGRPPDLNTFFAEVGPLSPAQVAAVLRADQRLRWQAGERIPVENYLARFPAVQADRDAEEDLVYGEYLLREQLGERPEPDEFARRFPPHAAVLRDQILAHRAMAVGRTTAYASQSPTASTAAHPAPPREALVVGPGAAVSDVQSLLRKRLRFISLVILAIYTYSFSFFAINVARSPGSFAQHISVLNLMPFVLVFVTSGASAVVLWTRRPLSLRSLRGIELTLFGLLLANQSWEFATDLFITPQFHAAGEWAGTSASNEPFLWFHSAYESLSYFILIITYATLVPSDWRRCTLVVGVMAATPLVISLVACFTTVVSPHTFMSFHTLPMGIYLGVSVAIAAYGTRRVESLRREAAAAREVGPYRLKELLGAGGMGEVYLAEHRLLKRPCAIKLIRPDKAADPRQLERFEREVQATAGLTHPNAVQVFDYGHTADGTFYYAMEYLPGSNLQEIVERHGPLPPKLVVHLLRQVCGALREAHAAGLIHRDIKPGNVIVCDRGGTPDVAKLLDFGLVRDISGGSAEQTAEGVIAGTPTYMSPEQAGGVNVDARSDLYSVGGLAYFLLTGRPPFSGQSAMKVVAAHLYEVPAPLSQHRPDVPDDLEAAVLRCLAKAPADRFQEVASLDAALGACDSASKWSPADAAAWWESKSGARTSSTVGATS